MKKIEWNKKTKDEKKWFLIKYIGAATFLIAGAIFGIVALAMYGWDFMKFITNPTVDLVFLCLIGIGVFFLSKREVK